MKPKILLINDDGIHAPEIKYLWKALADFADITIVAPSIEKSGAGVAITLRKPLLIEEVEWDNNTPAWKLINGTPADCAKMGLSVILKEKPDLIVSGINRGSNAGRNVLYSGTVGAVIEGAIKGISGIAFSCTDYEKPNYKEILHLVVPIVQHLLNSPARAGTFLNVNFPKSDIALKGAKLARQGEGFWKERPDARLHPEGKPYYWLGGTWHHCDEHEESDVKLLSEGYAAVVPIRINELTDHHYLEEEREAFLKDFRS